MRKGLVVLLAAVVVTAFAVPAMAGMDVSGMYRAKGFVSNFKALGAASTTPALDNAEVTSSYVETRLRMKFSFGDENVKAVYFAEMDPNWGIGNASQGAARNQGGALGADLINVETKNMYLWFKVPNTSVDFTVGLQNVSDSYAGVIFGYADMSGVFANFKLEPVALRIGTAKFFEGDVFQADDVDLYVAEAKFGVAKDVRLGANVYYIRDGGGTGDATPTTATADGPTTKVWIPGIDVNAKVGPAALSGFFLYQFGETETLGAPDIDIAGFAVDVRADLTLGPGKLFVEGLYVSGDDNPADTDYDSIITAGNFVGSQDYFSRTDMQILLSNIDDLSTNQPITTNVNFRNTGRGITHLAAGYSMKFTDKFSGKLGLGWAKVTEEQPGDPGSNLGFEVNANVNYNISKGLDFGLYGAFVSLGDFFDTASGPERVDPYDLHFRLNYAF